MLGHYTSSLCTLALAGPWVYVGTSCPGNASSSSHLIARCPKDPEDGGSLAAAVVATRTEPVESLAASGDGYLYWVGHGHLWRMLVDGQSAPGAPEDLSPGAPTTMEFSYLPGLALMGDQVYWSTAVEGGQLHRTPRAGGATGWTLTTDRPGQLAVDATHLYWLGHVVPDRAKDHLSQPAYSLMRVAHGSQDSQELVQLSDQDGNQGISGLALDSAYVWYVREDAVWALDR